MFDKLNKKNNIYEVIIGKHTQFKGDLTANGNIKIDGQLTGNIKSNGEIFIGENSIIVGNITSKTLSISGKVVGEIKAVGNLKISETGNLEGNILVSSFIINKGGTFKGNCNINTEEAKINLKKLDIPVDTEDTEDTEGTEDNSKKFLKKMIFNKNK
jgi:cytoskeletal protein CcmA (bactofilin family)